MASAPERNAPGHPFGIHRVKDPKVCLPQAAEQLDNTLPIYSNELLIRVERLNIDAASFVQMEEETRKDPTKIGEIVLENTRAFGKQQNQVTGSGGMLIGSIAQIGKKYRGPLKVSVGDRVASLISLTLTPLHIDQIVRVHPSTHQIEVKGHAILFESSIAALLPKDIPEAVAMAVYDVAGAPATVNQACRQGQTVVVIGAGGKAGLLSLVAARKKIGRSGKLIAIEPFEKACEDIDQLGLRAYLLRVDATDPVAVYQAVAKATRGRMADVVINVASVPNTENSALLSVKEKGKIIFFSMATSFSKVTLGAEGIATHASLLFGNGYYPNHARFSLDLLRKNNKLRALFERRYGAPV